MPQEPTSGVSYAATEPVTCPACGHGFPFDVWLIVAAAERPDLVDRIRGAALHAIACPQCGAAVGEVDAPLLLYTPPGTGLATVPPILFCPAQNTAAEQEQEQADGLVGLLRQRLGDAWQETWLAEGLPNLPQQMLPAVLGEDPETALREMAEGMQAELERMRGEDPDAYRQLEEAARQAMEDAASDEASLTGLVQRFVQADTWPESQRMVETHPELLSEVADAALADLIDRAGAAGDADAVRVFEEHRALLQRCREAGVARAFAEKTLPPEALEHAAAVGMSPELAEALAELAETGIEINSPDDTQTRAGRPVRPARKAGDRNPIRTNPRAGGVSI